MEIKIIRSKRKTISIQITEDLRVLVRAPLFLSDKEINYFVDSKSSWINKTMRRLKEQMTVTLPPYTKDELNAFKIQAEDDIRKRVELFSPIVGVSDFSVSFGYQLSRWGSCSAKNNLRFNCLLMNTPGEVRDYIVVHELCHLKHMNHSKTFWNEVKRVLPDYKISQKWLKEHEKIIISRLRVSKKQESSI